MKNLIATAGILFWVAVMIAATPHVLPGYGVPDSSLIQEPFDSVPTATLMRE